MPSKKLKDAFKEEIGSNAKIMNITIIISIIIAGVAGWYFGFFDF